MRGKRGFEMDFIAWVIIGVAVLILAFSAYFIITGKAESAFEYVKSLFLFRR